LLDLVGKIGNGLKSLGVKKGDRVVIYMPLCVEGVASMLACERIGAVPQDDIVLSNLNRG
jgi:acetyl-CoA synthetase